MRSSGRRQVWNDGDRPEGLLFGGRELAEAETWAAEHGDELARLDREFLDACRRAQARRRLYARILVGVAAAVVILAGVAVYFAVQAHHEARVSASGELLATAQANLDLDPPQSIQQALLAYEKHPDRMTLKSATSCTGRWTRHGSGRRCATLPPVQLG